MNTSRNPTWRVYERCVAAFQAENHGCELSITANARIISCITGVSRQVDVLIEARWSADISQRVIVDAKFYQSKLDVKDVEAFEGMMKDCRAHRGILVCPKGYSTAARRRAQDAITITVLTLEELDEGDWWAAFDECRGKCSKRPVPSV